MSNEKGKPSGSENEKPGTGIPQNIQPGTPDEINKGMEEYVNADEELTEQVRTNNPNRNVDKDDATNAGGYKN